MMGDDMTLVREFAASQSETAFAALVERHIGLVHSSSRRQVGDEHLADEITQAVFIILARKAATLGPKTILSAWLYRTTRYAAADALRTLRRRIAREQEAYMQSTLNEPTADEAWSQVAPVLDDALNDLGEADRTALVLRFFENKTAREIAEVLQTEENTAQRRVTRALDKLRARLVKRGVTLSAVMIAGTVAANSVQAAPAGMAMKISVVAAKGAAVSTSITTTVTGALKLMAWTKVKATLAAAVIIVCAAGGGAGLYVYQERHPSPAAELRAALRVEKPEEGSWQYPSVAVEHAIIDFGSNRADAFPILERALRRSDPETRKQAIAAMGLVMMPAMTRSNLESRLVSQHMDITNLSPGMLAMIESPPATNGVPLMRGILLANNEFSWFALSSLHGLLEPADIPELADLLVQSHKGDPTPPVISRTTTAEAARAALKSRGGNQELQRYVPEAIADTISRNPEAAAPFISSVEDLLDDSNADVRFGAACALVKYKGVNDPRIARELTAGLRSRHDDSRLYAGTEGLKQLMAIETLQRVGPGAKPMVPELLNYAKTIQDGLMRELALRAAGNIDVSLRDTMPEVDAAVKSDPNLRNVATAPAGK